MSKRKKNTHTLQNGEQNICGRHTNRIVTFSRFTTAPHGLLAAAVAQPLCVRLVRACIRFSPFDFPSGGRVRVISLLLLLNFDKRHLAPFSTRRSDFMPSRRAATIRMHKIIIVYFLLLQIPLQEKKVDHIDNPSVPCLHFLCVLFFFFVIKSYCTNHSNNE